MNPWRTLALSVALAHLAVPAAALADPPDDVAPPAEAVRSDASAGPSLTASLGAGRSRERGGEEQGDASLSLRASTPLAHGVHLEDGARSAWRVSGQGEAEAFATDLPEVAGSGRFLRLGVSLTGFYTPGGKDAFWLRAGTFVASQTSLLGSTPLRLHAVALGARRSGPDLRLLYGLAYSFRFGRGLPLPLLGVDWRFAPDWRFGVLLPARAALTWRASRGISVAGELTGAGDLFDYRAIDTSGVESRQVLHIARFRLGAAVGYAVAPGVRARLGAGVERMIVDTGLDRRRETGGYLGASLRFGGGGFPEAALEDDP